METGKRYLFHQMFSQPAAYALTGELFPLGGGVPSVEELQSKYAFTYYSTMTKAVTDVNNGAIGANADAEKHTAVAGVYTDENDGKNVVLLKDTTENKRIEPGADMTINLGGNTITFENDYYGFRGAKNSEISVTFDGRLKGSSVVLNGIDGGGVAIRASEKNRIYIVGGTYCINETVANETYDAVCIGVSASGLVELGKCSVLTRSAGRNNAVQVYGSAVIDRCKIESFSDDGISYGVHIVNASSSATITNSDIRAYSNYLYNENNDGKGNYSAVSHGVRNSGVVTINGGYVMGTHSGVQNTGTLHANGGIFEGFGHGGVYFAASDAVSSVRNAVIRDCDMPDGYTATASRNGAGFYMGGANEQVYMDNCKISGIAPSQIAVIKGSNNALYISNSTVNNTTGGDANIRIDEGGNKLYIGRGNNFTSENTSLPGAVIVTDEVYILDAV